MNTDNFTFLVIGLAQYLENVENGNRYPYPDIFRFSLNSVALMLGADYPKTMTGVLKLFSIPVTKWWTGDLPADFDREESLLEYGELSFEANAFLEHIFEDKSSVLQDSLLQIGIILDNRKFRAIFQLLSDKSKEDPDGAQKDYVTLRRFIIEHPYARLTEISRIFSQTKYIQTTDVTELYRKTNEIESRLEYRDSDGAKKLWLCPKCGPLYLKQGKLAGIKPSMCDRSCPQHQGGWQSISSSNQLMVLKQGIHLRVHLPGVPEIALFNWLEACREDHPNFLKGVYLWPRIDKYDLQIQFIDETWAVDVKDYQKPEKLGQTLTPIWREGELHWDKAFYVYPAFRETQRRDYGKIARLESGSRLTGIGIISDDYFKEQVMNKLASLKKRK